MPSIKRRHGVAAHNAVADYATGQNLAMHRAVRSVDAEAAAITEASRETAMRIVRLTPVLLDRLSIGEHRAAQEVAGQIMMLARQVEAQLLAAQERKRGALAMADAVLQALPPTRKILRY